MNNVVELKTSPAPDRIIFGVVAHERLMGGGLKTVWRNEALAIGRTDLRPSAKEPWRTTYFADALPGIEFASLRALRAALQLQQEAS